MRWHEPMTGDIRVKTFFAWFPVTDGLETRWLEQVTVRQRYFSGFGPISTPYWITVEFIDRKSGEVVDK